MNCPKCSGAAEFRKIKIYQDASRWEFYCESCKETFEITDDELDVVFIPTLSREAQLTNALQACLDALEGVVGGRWNTPNMLNAIYEARATLNEIRQK
jgi:uncharacterized protein YbaR (Trm112 family)